MKKSNQFDSNKTTLAVYYNEPPYDKKIAEIRQKGKNLEIKSSDPTLSKYLKEKLKKIAKNKLKYSVCEHKETEEGHETQFGYRTVSRSDEDYLIGLYWAVLDSHVTINAKYLLPRLLDEKGQVILRYGRKLPKNNLNH